jgi:hypothetical protein
MISNGELLHEGENVEVIRKEIFLLIIIVLQGFGCGLIAIE